MTRWDVFRYADGAPVVIDRDRCADRDFSEVEWAAIRHALRVWEQIRNESGFVPNGAAREVAIRKSCLLGRMLYDGLAPLDDPPPCSYSAPWYSLVENGRAYLSQSSLFAWSRDGREGLAIDQDPGWRTSTSLADDGSVALGDELLDRLPLDVAHDRAPGTWIVRLATADEAAGQAWWHAHDSETCTAEFDDARRTIRFENSETGEPVEHSDWLLVLERTDPR